MILHHDVAGSADAPALVLIHGITESSRSWDPLRAALDDGHRVLAVDLRGHGRSEGGDAYDPISYATDVVETMAHAGIARPLVIGHSLGGVVASAVAAISDVRAVINVDQPLRLAGFKDGLAQLEPMLRGSTEQFEQAISMLFAAMDGPLPEAERERIRRFGTPRQDVVVGTWESVLTSSPEELDQTVAALAGAITVPYLSLHGIDPGPAYGDWLRGLVPTATVEVWADLGHYPHLVAPTRFVERVQAFEATLTS